MKILSEPSPWKKAEYSDITVALWRERRLAGIASSALPPVPEKPARDPNVRIVSPGDMGDRGKGRSLESRIALLHSLAHIENWAIDLSWDIIARFGADPRYSGVLPEEFFDDFVTVADDECRHFRLLAKRLEEFGSHYGAHPAHDGLWESASRTAHSLPARLAVEHAVHEARGLDILPQTVKR